MGLSSLEVRVEERERGRHINLEWGEILRLRPVRDEAPVNADRPDIDDRTEVLSSLSSVPGRSMGRKVLVASGGSDGLELPNPNF